MQVHGTTNATAGTAIYSGINAAGAATAKKEQQATKDRVTLSQNARQMSIANNKSDTTSNTMEIDNLSSIENAINTGDYTIIGTAISGHLVTLIVE